MFSVFDYFDSFDIYNSDNGYKTETTENELKLFVYLAGVKKEDIGISVSNNELTIDAKNRVGYKDWKLKKLWKLSGINTESISSSYENGVLVVNLPKKNSENVRKIVVA